MNLQISVYRLQSETAQDVKELDELSKERHDQLLDVLRIRDKEREVII
jgi:hypothetical protein